ncbi:MAG: hypothetical protein JXJ04_24280 [Spirochaetales bacterium]|nr:hypothetical protein [Spirochaetales bacterium]
MKKLIIMVIAAGVVLLILSGCPMGITIESRIGMFESDLNSSDRSDVYLNFHPDTSSYNQIKDPDYFDGTPLAAIYKPIHFSNLSDSVDIGNGQERVTADFSSLGYSDTCTFIMEQSGIDWLIRRFDLADFNIQKSIQ